MNTPDELPLAAAVLAGGRSRRMGRDKATLEYKGQRLIDRQVALLRSLCPAELLVSARHGCDYGLTDATVVYDDLPDAGPLAGLAALLRECGASHLLVLAVDMPLMSAAMLRDMAGARRPSCGVVPRLGEAWEPLAAVYPREILPRAEARLHAGRRSMRGLIEEAIAHDEMHSCAVPPERRREFMNWNHPDDLPAPL